MATMGESPGWTKSPVRSLQENNAKAVYDPDKPFPNEFMVMTTFQVTLTLGL